MLVVSELTKHYGSVVGLEDVSFEIAKGEVIGLLGVNGAGKTTLLRLLACLSLPSWGQIELDGVPFERASPAFRRRIGFLPERPPLYPEMTVEQYLTFVCRLRGASSRHAARLVRETSERVSIGHMRDRLIGQLSHGYRQRVGLAQALVHQPDLVLLDEPSNGLDPVQRTEMRALIQGLKGSHSVILSSHVLAEVSQLCDRLLIVDGGRLVAQGPESALAGVGDEATCTLELEFESAPHDLQGRLQSLEGVLELAPLGEREHAGEVTYRVRVRRQDRAELVRALVAAGLPVTSIARPARQLETLFLQLTHGREERARS